MGEWCERSPTPSSAARFARTPRRTRPLPPPPPRSTASDCGSSPTLRAPLSQFHIHTWPHCAISPQKRSESTASPIGSTGIASVPHVCSPRRRALSPPSSRLRDDDDRSWPRVTQLRYAAPGPLRPAVTPAEPRRGRAKRMNMGKEVHVSSMVMTAWRLVASRLLGPGCQMISREPLNPDRTMYLYSTCAPTPPRVGQSSQAQRLGLRADAG